MAGLLDRRLVFVTGKGGVGKSTVASALGLIGARRGRRTIVAELASQERVGRAFAAERQPFRETELDDGLFTISIDPQHAMEEYLRLKAGAMGGILSSSRLFGAFAMATPGMRELLSIGKVWELSQDERRTKDADVYDLVIVDAPATGHGLGFLRTPRTFAEIARVGPIAHQGRQIAETLTDRSFTALVAVTTLEEMPVNETLSLRSSVGREGLGLDLVVVNAVLGERFDDGQVPALRAAAARAERPLARTALRAALTEHARMVSQQRQGERLAAGLTEPSVTLPYLFCDGIGRPEIERLAAVLEAAL